MKTIELQVYKFNELSDKVQTKLITQFDEYQDFYHYYDEFKYCLSEFLSLFNIDKNQVDCSFRAFKKLRINLQNVDNSIFKRINKKFINAIDDELTGICYGIYFVKYLKESFAEKGSVKLAINYALENTLNDFHSELDEYRTDSYIISTLENLDFDYLADGTRV